MIELQSAKPTSADFALATSSESRFRFELATIEVLWKRDVVRFFRQRSRLIGALAQPLIFWGIIGKGFAGTFRIPGAENVGYVTYFYPGIVLMVILFTSIFATMSLIEDRHQGFLQAVLAAPSSRFSLVIGKVLGSTSIALIQVALILLLAPLAGFSFGQIDWLSLVPALVLTSIALSALGFSVAWFLDNVQGYHGVMSVLLIPLWIVSGAMFPATAGSGWLAIVTKLNPLSYAALGVRRALSGGELPSVIAGSSSKLLELGAITGFAVGALILATLAARRRA